MGGKNGIIVCKDAELDQAISSCIYSAFAHAGQKCSACSRILVHTSILKEFAKRFTSRANEIPVGLPELSESIINPLISSKEKEKSLKNANDMRSCSKKYNEKILLDIVGPFEDNLVGPLIIQINEASLVDREHPVYHEMFAPFIYIIPFDHDEQAVSIFNNTSYALTGGVFTQSDLTIDFFISKLKAGNLYFNRNITGARVAIEPFGGFYLSGTGPKAGGPDYLNAFRKNELQDNHQKVVQKNNPRDETSINRIENSIVRLANKVEYNKQIFLNWLFHTSLLSIDENTNILPENETLSPILGQTTYLDYQIKKEEVIFIFYDTSGLIQHSILKLIYLCLELKIKITIICLSRQTFQLFNGSSAESSVIALSEKDFIAFPFSPNTDLVIHNNDPEIAPLILKIFSDKQFYQRKILKILTHFQFPADNKLISFAKILFETRTIAINTMRYGAPLEKN